MKTPSFSLNMTFPTMLCSESLGSVQMCQQRSWFSEALVYTSLETTFLIPFSSQLLPSSAWPWAELQGREKQEKSRKEKCTAPQDRDNSYFYRTLLGSLEKLGGFNNVHLNSSKFRDNWKSVIARVKHSSCLTAYKSAEIFKNSHKG